MTTEQKQTFWHNHIAGWQHSGMSQAEYCQQHDLKLTSFGYWRTRLNRPQHTSKLIPVDFTSAATIRLALPNGIRLESPVHALADVLAVLKQAFGNGN